MFRHMTEIQNARREAKARRAATKVGLRAVKSRWRRDTIENHGGFQLRDPQQNIAVDGLHFDMTADEVIEYCSGSN
jgi:hypothetical protein